MNESKVANIIRTRWALPVSFSDESILEASKGTLFRAWIEVGIAFDELKGEVINALPNVISRFLKRQF